MAPSFGRSISFPLSPARSSSRAAARHVRSVSLPSSRAHPLLAHLHNTIRAVRDWAAQPASAPAGLTHIDALHTALAELLLLPEAQAALCSSSSSSDRLMDAFLLLADAYGTFQETLLSLKADVADVQAAVRRRDAARIASAARSQRRNDKDLARLAAATVSLSSKTTKVTDHTDMMAAALIDAAAACAAASAAVFSAVASMSASTASSSSSSSSSKNTVPFAAAFTAKKETAVDEDKIEEFAQCIRDCENGSDSVFRSIVRTRVSLLNIRSHSGNLV